MRRYETTCSRSLHKAIDSIIKMRLVAKDRDGQIENDRVPTAALEFDPELHYDANRTAESIDHPVVSTRPAVIQTELEYPAEAPHSDSQVQDDAIAIIENPVSRNEPSLTAEDAFLRNEPSADRRRCVFAKRTQRDR